MYKYLLVNVFLFMYNKYFILCNMTYRKEILYAKFLQ